VQQEQQEQQVPEQQLLEPARTALRMRIQQMALVQQMQQLQLVSPLASAMHP
jgi:hypothetical protein